jgi:phosphate-selective porin OprO/OprP
MELSSFAMSEGDMIGGLNILGRNLLAGVSVIGIFTYAYAVPEAKAQDLKEVQAQIEALQATVKALQKQVQDAQSAAAQTAAADAKGSDLDLKVKWKGAPELSSSDGKFKFKVRGRLEADYNAIDQDESITGRPDVSAAEIRRARIGVEGVVWTDVKYIVEVDFANDAPALKDAYAEYTGLAEGLSLRAGNFKTPNSLDQMTSANYLTFMERPAFIEAWGLDRQIGGGVIYNQEHFTLSAGIFGPTPFADEVWLEDVKTAAARLTVAPINREVNGVNQVVHLGASWRGREGAEDLRTPSSAQGGSAGTLNPYNDQFFRYRARGADLHLADRFVSSPQIFDQDTFWGLEAAAVLGPWHVQAEYSQLEGEVSPLFQGSDPTYTGWYVETGYFLTGETRPYKDGIWQRVKVKNPVVWSKGGGWGAWQLAARYDVLDLTDQAVTLQGNPTIVTPPLNASSLNCTLCGEQSTWQVGVNWYLNDYTRIFFNYGESDIGGGPLLLANGASANGNDGANIKGFGTRVHVDW